MIFGYLSTMMLTFFNVIAWPSFTLLCPLYASIRAIESHTHSNYRACLTYWVLGSIATILESMLAKLLVRLPFWPYAKGIAILLLVVPYFRGASYVYLHFVKPYIYANSQFFGLMLTPKAKVCLSKQQNDIVDAAERYDREKNEVEAEKVVIYEGESISIDDTIKSDLKWPPSPKKVQKEWSCALCFVSTTSKKCLQNHFQGKNHKSEAEHRRNQVVEKENGIFHFTMKTADKMTSTGNGNRNKWDNLKNLSHLLNPLAGSISWCTWKKPEFGWTKLNADGSVDRDNARFGGLFRDYKGVPICAYISKAPIDDIFLVELWAIWRGLVLALGLGIKVIWVESDSMSVVKTINKEQSYGSWASSCLKHIWILLEKFDKYIVSHSWRETNRAADHLSKMDVGGSDVVLWPVDFPDRLRNIISDDAQGRWYRRG
ncbi:HVA22-like protein [Actinidia chinensis var. chinensis]|uniref:HVA22-like protein n=1 Tax=Actinidia chinensis var. chinensis TaxID=1590841 RepID=A0A2R6RNI0_ACTCC|nr:HVA22-like protein [Actinidia chinensis var. chinensis]